MKMHGYTSTSVWNTSKLLERLTGWIVQSLPTLLPGTDSKHIHFTNGNTIPNQNKHSFYVSISVESHYSNTLYNPIKHKSKKFK